MTQPTPALHDVGAIDESFVPALLPGIVHVPVQDEAVLYLPADGTLHLLDPIAALVCGGFDDTTTVGQLVDEFAEAFGASRDRVADDVLALLRTLGGSGLLAGVAPDPDRTPTVRIEEDLVDGC